MTAVLDRPVATTPPGAPPGEPIRRRRAGGPLPRVVYRFRLATVCLGLVALAFLQDPGRIAADTKLDLTQDPWGFLGRALHLWDPNGFFGQLQNQAYGYLWPMGPFFGLGTSLGLPPWVVQRVWWSLILVVAFLGAVRLARLIGITSPLARVMGGLAFALAPRMLSTIGPLSSEAWVMALAPWILVPLVVGSTRGSPRRWAAVSGLVVLCLGAVNAVATLAVLPLGLLWIVTRERGPRRRSLFWWWGAAVALASLWWFLPLVILGRYSPPFLDWIESAAVTTGRNTPSTVLRGATQWVAYVADGSGPVWGAGWTLVHERGPLIATGLMAAVGLAGLASRRCPERRFLVLALLVGFLLVSVGHTGTVSGLGAGAVQSALDGLLAPLRNVHKFDPLLRLPLALGFATAVSAIVAWRPDRARNLWRYGAWVGVVGVLVLATTPAWTSSLTRDRSFQEIPGYWREAAAWLNAQAGSGRTLLLPASSFGDYLWGRTQDEPLQPLLTVPWGTRDAVPLSSAGNIRWLDSVGDRISTGRGSPGLSTALTRAGVRWILVRNDLDRTATDSPRPSLVQQALAQSPGIRWAASFGPALPPYRTADVVIDDALDGPVNALNLYEVTSIPVATDARVSVTSADRAVVVTGGAETVADLADAGILGDRPVILAGDPGAGAVSGPGVLTEGNRRLEVNFGRIEGNRSSTFGPATSWQFDRRVHDYVASASPNSVAVLDQGAEITASSSGSDAGAFRARSPAAQPFAALDGDPETAWVSGDLAGGVGQWWEIRYPSPRPLASVSVRLMTGALVGPPAETVRVTTDNGSEETTVRDTFEPQPLSVTAGETRSVRVELAGVVGGGPGQGFGLREVIVPGWTVTRSVTVPAGDARGGVILSARRGERPGCVTTVGAVRCSDRLSEPGEERAGLVRDLNVAVGGEYRLEVGVQPKPGTNLDRLLQPLPGSAIVAAASSQLVADPRSGGQAAADRDPATSWVAAAVDRRPTLTLTLPEARRVSGLRFGFSPDLAASRPLQVTVAMGRGPARTVAGFVGSTGRFALPPTVTDRVVVSFGTVNPLRSTSNDSPVGRVMPVGVSEIVVIGADDLRQPTLADQAVDLPCGFGPTVRVGDRDILTSFSSTVGRLRALAPGIARACDAAGEQPSVSLAPGDTRVAARPTAELLVDRVALIPLGVDVRRETSDVAVTSWEATSRSVELPMSPRQRILELTENFNAGWGASLGGSPLAAVRVDGWRQAFVVPGGAGGRVEIDFAPAGWYRLALGVGLGAVMVLLMLAVVPGRRGARPEALREGAGRAPLLVLGAGGVAILTAGLGGLVVCAVVAAFARLASTRPHVRRAWPVFAGGCLVPAVIVDGWATWPASLTLPAWAQLVAGLSAVAALLATALSPIRRAGPVAAAAARGEPAAST